MLSKLIVVTFVFLVSCALLKLPLFVTTYSPILSFSTKLIMIIYLSCLNGANLYFGKPSSMTSLIIGVFLATLTWGVSVSISHDIIYTIHLLCK